DVALTVRLRPGAVALDADQPAAGELILTADLSARERAAHVDRVGHRSARHRDDAAKAQAQGLPVGEVGAARLAADVTADVAAGPAVVHDRRGCLEWHVRRHSRPRDHRRERYASKQELFHLNPPSQKFQLTVFNRSWSLWL